MTVLETDIYRQRAEDLFTREEREGVRAFVAASPEAGDMISGLAGLRKLRWTQASRHKGKRGGTRIVYFYAASHSTVILMYAYSKEQKEDLTNADRKNLATALGGLKRAIAESHAGKDQPARRRTRKGS